MIAETAQDDASIVQTTLNLDYHPVFGWTYSCYDDVAIEAVKGVDATILCPQPFKNWTDVGSQLEATMKQYGPSKWHWNYITVLSWIGAHMFVDAAKTVNGPVTRQSVVNAMNHVTNFTNEFLPRAHRLLQARSLTVGPEDPELPVVHLQGHQRHPPAGDPHSHQRAAGFVRWVKRATSATRRRER